MFNSVLQLPSTNVAGCNIMTYKIQYYNKFFLNANMLMMLLLLAHTVHVPYTKTSLVCELQSRIIAPSLPQYSITGLLMSQRGY